MKSFREILSEKSPEETFKTPQKLRLNVGGTPSSSMSPSTGGIVKKVVGKPKPTGSSPTEVAKRAKRFSQAFGTPTGADPRTGSPTYAPPKELTDLPSSRTGGTPKPEAYGKVEVGGLEKKRAARTAEVPDTPGVRKATPQGVRNFLLNRETKGMSRRTISPEEGKAAMQRVAKAMQDPGEVSRASAKINQEVGGRRATRAGSSTPKPFPVSQKDMKTLQRMARPETSQQSVKSLKASLGTGAGKRAQAASDAAKGIKQYLDKEKVFHQRVLKAVQDLPPEKSIPTSSRTTAQKAKPGIYKVPTSRQLPAPSPAPVSKQLSTPAPTAVKTPPKEVKLPKPAKPKLTQPKVTTKGIEKSITNALQADRKAADAAKNIEKAAKASKIAKGFKVATRIAAPVAAGLDAYGGYQAARETGASQKRSIGAGIARAAGGLIGGAAGGAVGSVLGPAGSVAGTVGGYGAGSELGTKIYNKLTGPVGKDFKVSDLSKNVKSGLKSAGKSYTTFVSQANKALAKYA